MSKDPSTTISAVKSGLTKLADAASGVVASLARYDFGAARRGLAGISQAAHGLDGLIEALERDYNRAKALSMRRN